PARPALPARRSSDLVRPAMTGQAPSTAAAARPQLLDTERLPDHLDRLFAAAWALCGSRHEAEDLVQETFVNVLKRPRFLREGSEDRKSTRLNSSHQI